MEKAAGRERETFPSHFNYYSRGCDKFRKLLWYWMKGLWVDLALRSQLLFWLSEKVNYQEIIGIKPLFAFIASLSGAESGGNAANAKFKRKQELALKPAETNKVREVKFFPSVTETTTIVSKYLRINPSLPLHRKIHQDKSTWSRGEAVKGRKRKVCRYEKVHNNEWKVRD